MQNKSLLKKQFDKVFDDVSVDLDSDQSLEPSFEGELEETKTDWRRKSRRSHVRKSERLSQGHGIIKKKRVSTVPGVPAPAIPDDVYMAMEPTTSDSSDPPVLYPNIKKFHKANPVPNPVAFCPEGLFKWVNSRNYFKHC